VRGQAPSPHRADIEDASDRRAPAGAVRSADEPGRGPGKIGIGVCILTKGRHIEWSAFCVVTGTYEAFWCLILVRRCAGA